MRVARRLDGKIRVVVIRIRAAIVRPRVALVDCVCKWREIGRVGNFVFFIFCRAAHANLIHKITAAIQQRNSAIICDVCGIALVKTNCPRVPVRIPEEIPLSG